MHTQNPKVHSVNTTEAPKRLEFVHSVAPTACISWSRKLASVTSNSCRLDLSFAAAVFSTDLKMAQYGDAPVTDLSPIQWKLWQILCVRKVDFSARAVVIVCADKENKDSHVLLPQWKFELLRRYWREYRPRNVCSWTKMVVRGPISRTEAI
jgi:hypothetical protein